MLIQAAADFSHLHLPMFLAQAATPEQASAETFALNEMDYYLYPDSRVLAAANRVLMGGVPQREADRTLHRLKELVEAG